jgi:hypothetical protein
MLLAKGYGARMEIQPNYISIWKMATSKPDTPIVQAA